MLLYAAIIGFILSNIIALALLFTGKRLSPGWFRILASLHLVLGVVFFYQFFTNKSEEPRYLSFLFFFCSGIITGGLALGTRAHMLLKIYFGLFCLSVFVFIVSPSALLHFLITASFTVHSGQIPVQGKFFLEKQSSAFSAATAPPAYKLIEKNGFFHRTISRDIDFKGTVDSIRVISFESNKETWIRGYTSSKSFVEDRIDSTDVRIDLNPQKKDEIERRL